MKLAKHRWMAIILGVSLFLGAFGIALAATVVFQVTRQVDSALSLSAALVLADENLGLYHDADATQPFTGEEKLEFVGFRLQPPLEGGKARPEASVYIKNESNIELTLIAPCGEVISPDGNWKLGHLDGEVENTGGEHLGVICDQGPRLAPGQVVFVQLNLFLNPELPEGDYGFTTVFGAIGEGEEPSSLDIFVMDVADLDGDGNGDNLTRLTNVQGFDGRSAWHPSGNQIAFCTERVGFGDFEIFVMDAVDTDGDGNGENPTQLTNAPGFSCSPDWMDRIVFHSNRDGQRNIYVMDPVDTDGDGNGENLIRLTDNGVDDSLPAWSPDLSRIAFNSNRGDGVRHIYVMDAVDNDGDGNGDNLFRLTVGPERVVGADWSPYGSRIAFAWIRDGNFEIFVMDAADLDGDGNGDNLTRLTTNEAGDFFAAWSPDGNQIAFDSNRDGNREIYVMDAADVDGDGNGDNLIRMTTSEADDGVPAWSPDGSRIAFRSDR